MSGEDSRHKRTVRVLNLSEDTTEDELTTYFRGRKDGESNVQDVIMFSDKNEAHVVFKDAEVARAVLSKEHKIKESIMKVEIYQPGPEREIEVDQSSKEARTVVVTDIPKGESESSLFIHFQKKKNAGGEVEKVRLSRTGETAWVVFEKHEVADAVVNTKQVVNKKRVKVQLSQPQSKENKKETMEEGLNIPEKITKNDHTTLSQDLNGKSGAERSKETEQNVEYINEEKQNSTRETAVSVDQVFIRVTATLNPSFFRGREPQSYKPMLDETQKETGIKWHQSDDDLLITGTLKQLKKAGGFIQSQSNDKKLNKDNKPVDQRELNDSSQKNQNVSGEDLETCNSGSLIPYADQDEGRHSVNVDASGEHSSILATSRPERPIPAPRQNTKCVNVTRYQQLDIPIQNVKKTGGRCIAANFTWQRNSNNTIVPAPKSNEPTAKGQNPVNQDTPAPSKLKLATNEGLDNDFRPDFKNRKNESSEVSEHSDNKSKTTEPNNHLDEESFSKTERADGTFQHDSMNITKAINQNQHDESKVSLKTQDNFDNAFVSGLENSSRNTSNAQNQNSFNEDDSTPPKTTLGQKTNLDNDLDPDLVNSDKEKLDDSHHNDNNLPTDKKNMDEDGFSETEKATSSENLQHELIEMVGNLLGKMSLNEEKLNPLYVIQFIQQVYKDDLEEIKNTYGVDVVPSQDGKGFTLKPMSGIKPSNIEEAMKKLQEFYDSTATKLTSTSINLREFEAGEAKKIKRSLSQQSHADVIIEESNGHDVYTLVGDAENVEMVRRNVMGVLQKNTPVSEITEPMVSIHDSIRVILMQGDIEKQECDAIVNFTDKDLVHKTGIAKAIKQAAGVKYDIECREIIAENGPLVSNMVTITTAGSLPCKQVIHAILPDSKKERSSEVLQYGLKEAYRLSLNKANENKMKSISFPVVTQNIVKLPQAVSSSLLFHAITEFIKENSLRNSNTIEEIRVIHRENLKQVKEYAKEFSKNFKI